MNSFSINYILEVGDGMKKFSGVVMMMKSFFHAYILHE